MIILFIIIIFLTLFSVAITGLSLIIWLPTKSLDLARILKLARLQPGETFYDLGCGDGKVVIYLGKRTEARVIGLELAWPLFLVCKLRQFLAHRPNINFKLKNLFKADLTQADVIYIFGIPEKLKERLRPKLEAELKPGSRIISYAFKIEGWQPTSVDESSETQVSIYLYQR